MLKLQAPKHETLRYNIINYSNNILMYYNSKHLKNQISIHEPSNYSIVNTNNSLTDIFNFLISKINSNLMFPYGRLIFSVLLLQLVDAVNVNCNQLSFSFRSDIIVFIKLLFNTEFSFIRRSILWTFMFLWIRIRRWWSH